MCLRQVTRTTHHRIHGHYDKGGTVCLASFEPYHITISKDERC